MKILLTLPGILRHRFGVSGNAEYREGDWLRIKRGNLFVWRILFLLIFLTTLSGCAQTKIYPLQTSDANDTCSVKVKSNWKYWLATSGFRYTSTLRTSDGQSKIFKNYVEDAASNGDIAVLSVIENGEYHIVFIDIASNEIIQKWDFVNKRCQEIMDSEFIYDHRLEHLCISRDGKYFATYHEAGRAITFGYSGVVLMWDVAKAEVCKTYFVPLRNDSKAFRCNSLDMEFSPDNSVLAYYGLYAKNGVKTFDYAPDYKKRKGLLVLWETEKSDKYSDYSGLIMPKRRNFIKQYPLLFRIISTFNLHQIDWVKEDGKYAVELQADQTVYVCDWEDE